MVYSRKTTSKKQKVTDDDICILYHIISKAMNSGKKESPSEDEEPVVYFIVDMNFDKKCDTETLMRVAESISKEYAVSFISKKIARDYLKDHKSDFEFLRLGSKDIYVWPTSERDKMLGTIYFYARHRDKNGERIKCLSHYLSDCPNLVDKVRERLKDDLNDMCDGLACVDEMPSSKFDNQEKIEMIKRKYNGLIRAYQGAHEGYIGRFKRR